MTDNRTLHQIHHVFRYVRRMVSHSLHMPYHRKQMQPRIHQIRTLPHHLHNLLYQLPVQLIHRLVTLTHPTRQ